MAGTERQGLLTVEFEQGIRECSAERKHCRDFWGGSSEGTFGAFLGESYRDCACSVFLVVWL